MEFTRLDPLTGEVASTAIAMSAADAAAIAAKAGAAQPAWGAMGPNARRAVLMKAADALAARKDDFVAAMCAETGATAGWSMFNLMLSVSMVREAAALTTQIRGEVIPSDKPGCVAMALKEPVGVIPGALIDAPAVKRINFTGSTGVGRIIATRAAQNLKPCLLELGGKAPFLVLEDADLDEAVKAAAFGAFMNQGQICMSTERIIVVDAVADAFAEKFAAKVSSMATGDPREGNTPLGAVVDQKTVHHVNALIDDAVGKGETVLMPATVVDGVTDAMNLYRDESFGPVVAMIRARDTDHAIALANDSEYGLSAAVFTRDTAKGLTVAKQIKSGICHINGPTVHDEAQMPFGGVGASGYGRFGGMQGIDSFTETRWITMETLPGHFPI